MSLISHRAKSFQKVLTIFVIALKMICCVFQLYQSLDHELQRHVNLKDALQQCQTWLTSVSVETDPHTHPPLNLDEALQQVSIPVPTP